MSEQTFDEPLLGRTIAGKYAITSFIGEGAMGSVYRARHVTLDSVVAVKVLKTHARRPQSDGDGFAERFRREAQAASRLDHPNSVRVIDYGQEPDGLLYLVMELLDGRELAAIIHEEFPLPVARVVSILGQALAAVAIAHDQGIIHRDLKPENIMILRRADDDGAATDVVKVCDFGIAKLQHAERTEDRRLTTQGEVIGTPEFMSPEQARGEALDARSDLYSMGVILFEMLTSRSPFEADTALGIALKHVTDAPPAPSSLEPRVDPTLERICLKALSKRREDRYQTAREMRLELRSAIDLPMSLRTGPRSVVDAPTSTAPLPAVTQPAPAAPPRADTIATGAVIAATPSVASAPTPVAERRKRGLLIGALGLVLLGAAGAFALRRGGGQEEVPSSASAKAAAQWSAEPPVTTASAAPIDSIADAAPAPAPTVAPESKPAASVVATAKPAATTTKTGSTATATAPPSTVALMATAPEVTVANTAAPTATATATATAAPTSAPTPTVAAAAPFDPTSARAVIVAATATNGVSGSSVRASLNIEAISRCYRGALEAKGAPASGTATLKLAVDEGGHVTSASLLGATFLPSMKGCVEGIARTAKIKGVDTGDAVATVSLSFVVK